MTTFLARKPTGAARSTAAHGALVRMVRAAAHIAQRRPKTIIAAWLLLVVVCLASGAFAGTRSLTDVESEVGQSGQADALLHRAGLRDPATESILITGRTPAAVRAAAADLGARAPALPQVASVTGPAQSADLVADGGRVALVQVRLRGDPDHADDRVSALLALDAQVA